MNNSIKARLASLQAIVAQKQTGVAILCYCLKMARGRLAERRKALQRCFRRNRQHEIIYQTAKALSLSTFKKNSAAAHEKERIIYTMSEFNIYARKLDTAFKEARSEYNTAFRALQEA